MQHPIRCGGRFILNDERPRHYRADRCQRRQRIRGRPVDAPQLRTAIRPPLKTMSSSKVKTEISILQLRQGVNRCAFPGEN